MNKTDPDPICLRSEYSTKKRRRQEKFLPTSFQLIKKSCEDFFDKLHPPSILIISKCCFAPKVIDIKTFGRRFIVFEVSLFSLRLGHGAALTCHRHVIHYRAAAALPLKLPLLLYYLCQLHIFLTD